MKNKIDKIRVLAFNVVTPVSDGSVYGHVLLDIKKLRRVPHDELQQLVEELTLRIYPFAILGNYLHRYSDGTAEYPVRLPLSPNLHVTQEGE